MSEVLSQNEIDDLLNALSTGEINVTEINQENEGKKVKPYDFRRPEKFAKDQLRTMQVIYENYSRMIASHLSGILRDFCQVEVVSVEPQTYYEFINSLPDPAVLGILDFRPLKGSAIMELSPDIAFSIIDKLLGGSGAKISQKRDFTEIEINLLMRVFKGLISLMDETWINVIETKFKLDRIETNPQFAQIVSPNETIAIITMNVSIGEIEGMINFCIPHIVIEPIIEQLSTKHWYSSGVEGDIDEEQSKLLARKINDAYVDIRAVLGCTEITVGEFTELQVGDVIKLESRAKEEIPLIVGGQLKFLGIIGTKSNRYAIQITKKEGNQ